MASAPLSLHMVFHHFLPPYEGQRPVSQWVRGMTIPKNPLNFCEESSRLLYPLTSIFLSKQGVSTHFAGIIVDHAEKGPTSWKNTEHWSNSRFSNSDCVSCRSPAGWGDSEFQCHCRKVHILPKRSSRPSYNWWGRAECCSPAHDMTRKHWQLTKV